MLIENKLASDEFVIMAEMIPPKGTDVSPMLTHAERVKNQVDAFLVPEMGNAVMKMSSLGGAMLMQRRGLESVLQVCCRDRNRLALQGDLLAAGAMGVTTVMAVTGENITFGDHHQAKVVDDIDIYQLLQAIQGLQDGRDMAGVELSGAPSFFLGSTVSAQLNGEPTGADLEEIDRKSQAGARFFVTQPVFDLQALSGFQQRLESRDCSIIPTVLLLKSLGMARYIDRHFEHVRIPAFLMRRIQKSPNKVQDCVKIAADLIRGMRDMGCGGVLISTIGWEDKLQDILNRV